MNLETNWREVVRAAHIVPQRVVLAHGCFDLLHVGHIRHLQAARALGDRLVVSVTADPHVGKGMGRPRFTAQQRMEALLAMDCVDEVMLSDSADAIASIERIKPAVYVKGIDYADRDDAALNREVAAVREVGGRFETTKTEKWSSSRLINGETYPDATLKYLDTARQRGFRDKILAAFDRADKLNIVFVGETIEDEYVYVSPLGKPAKETILATAEVSREKFRGGVVAAAKHGEWPKAKTITSELAYITKTRFVDADFNRKLFEVYSQPDLGLSAAAREKFHVRLIDGLRGADAVMMFDFGHGLMTAQERHIVESAKFLALNTQSNAGNYGFNLVTRYKRADLVCIDEPEARLAAGRQSGADAAKLTYEIAGRMAARRFILTCGKRGAVACEHLVSNDDVAMCVDHDIPPFATGVADTMGAGDAVLAVAGPLVAAGLELEAAAFVGNVAGAIKVSIVGHRRHVGRQELIQSVEALLA